MYLSLIVSSFLLFAIPLFSGILIILFFRRDFSLERFKKVFFIGLIFYLIAQMILLIFGHFYEANYDKLPLFIYLWVHEDFIIILAALAGYYLLLKNGLVRQDSYRDFSLVFSYTSGFLVLSGLIRIISSSLKFDAYKLFLFPMICFVLLLLFPIILIEAGTRRGYISILIYSLFLPLSLVLAVIPWLFYLNYYVTATGVALAALSGAGVLFFILKKGYTGN